MPTSMIPFEKNLLSGKFIKRYKRFFADIEMEDGSMVTAHCPNTGSMKSLLVEGSPALFMHHDDPKRKLKYTLECLKPGKSWALVNTHRPNRLGYEWVKSGAIPELTGYTETKREVKYGENSKIDIFLSGHGKKKDCYVEIKNVTLKVDSKFCAFPDSVSTRGQKHLRELANLSKNKTARAVMLFMVNRADCSVFRPAHEIDPDYAAEFKAAKKAGVEMLAYQTKITQKGVAIGKKLEIKY